jgi:serine/threonine protein kinase
MGRHVALSVVRSRTAEEDPEGIEREAKVLGRIGAHDNIVSIYDYDVSAGADLQFTVFEYLSGGTLMEVVQKDGALPAKELLRFSRQLTRGLAHLHTSGVLHRDVAPKNVLFDERGVAHLGDFDSAVLAGDSRDDYPEITDHAFAPPEERHEDRMDVRSDLYSLGSVLFVAATGSSDPIEPNLLRERRPELPTSFADLVEQLLEVSPNSRPESSEAVLQWLDDIRRASSIDDLIASSGETGQVEFKSSLLHSYHGLTLAQQKKVEAGVLTPQEAEKENRQALQHSVCKTIAALLNSDGGMLLIGVTDHRQIVGIEADFAYPELSKPDVDGWTLYLKLLIKKSLGSNAFSSIRISLVRHGDDTNVAVINCPSRRTETWLRNGARDEFFIRTANSTEQLEGPALINYVREHWPAGSGH